MWLYIALGAPVAGATVWGLGYQRGYSKASQNVTQALLERSERALEALKKEYEDQLEEARKIEPVIQERIVYRDRWRTRIETVIEEKPTAVECSAVDPARVQGFNEFIREINHRLSSLRDLQ
jgi:hypothetical protein